jgi:hypothetical protein
MKKIISLLALVLATTFCAHAQATFATVSGSNVQDSTGSKLASGTITFAPVNNAGKPLSFRAGGSGQVISSPVNATVTNGAFSIQLADTTQTFPANVCYAVTVTNNVTGQSILGPGYSCVQMSSSWCSQANNLETCNFDSYMPNNQAGVVDAAPSLTVGNVVSGGNAAASITGTKPNYQLNLTLPSGPAPSLSMGNFTTLPAGSAPTFAFNGGGGNYVFDVGIPSSGSATAGGVNGEEQFNNGGQLLGLPGPFNVLVPMFGEGSPITSISVTNGACTSTPTITIPAPGASADGTQATAKASCVNGQTVVTMSFFGSGYLPTQANSATISGGGTSGASVTLNMLTPGVADPTGTNDSTAAIWNALDYAVSQGTSSDSTPQVKIPAGKYRLTSELFVPSGITVKCDGQNATVLEETNNLAGITIYQANPQMGGPFTAGGSISGCTFDATGNSAYTASMVEAIGTTGYKFDRNRLTGGAGPGLTISAERMRISNVTFDQVRLPIVNNGEGASNENLYDNIIIDGTGESGDGVCFGTNCPDGTFPSYNWLTGATIISAVGNGSTATFEIQCNSACGEGSGISPITAGHWFNISGIGDLTSLNGIWQAATVQNNYPAAGDFTITTGPLQTGNVNSPFTVGPDGLPMVYQPTAVSVTGTSASLSSAVFQPVIWPQNFDAGITLQNSTESKIIRTSIKSNWYGGGIEDIDPSEDSVSGAYVEGYPIHGQPHANVDVSSGGYVPYTNITSAFSATNCQNLAPCTVPVVDGHIFFNQVNTIQEANSGVAMDLVCPDYNPGSTSPCAANSSILQDQYEVVDVVFTPDGNAQILARNLSGSTAPANSTWPVGSHLGWTESDTTHEPFNDTTPNLDLSDDHLEGYDAPGTQWDLYSDNGSPFVPGGVIAGVIPDNVIAFPLGAGGPIPVGQGITLDSTQTSTGYHIVNNGSITNLNSIGNAMAITGTQLASGAFSVTGTGVTYSAFPLYGSLSLGTISVPQSGSSFTEGCGTISGATATASGTASSPCFGAHITGTQNDASISTVLGVTGSSTFNNAPFSESLGSANCSYATGSTHALMRTCMSVTGITMDEWTGSAWANQLTIPASGNISGAALGGVATLSGNNTFTGTSVSWSPAVNGSIYKIGGGVSASAYFKFDAYGDPCLTENGGTSCIFSVNSAGNGSVLGGWAAAQFSTNSGATPLYRCTTAGTEPVGAVVASQSLCGASTAVGFIGN